MLGMEDRRVKEHLIRNSVRETSWNQMREEILEITRTQQHIDSQSMPVQLGANSKSKGKGKDSKGKGKGKDAKNESSKKAKNDDQRKCNKSGHVKAECRKRLKDLADAEERPVAATPRPSGTAVVPLQCILQDERHTSTFVMAMPGANSETRVSQCANGDEARRGWHRTGRNTTRETHCCDSVKGNILDDGHVRRCNHFSKRF